MFDICAVKDYREDIINLYPANNIIIIIPCYEKILIILLALTFMSGIHAKE